MKIKSFNMSKDTIRAHGFTRAFKYRSKTSKKIKYKPYPKRHNVFHDVKICYAGFNQIILEEYAGMIHLILFETVNEKNTKRKYLDISTYDNIGFGKYKLSFIDKLSTFAR